MRNKWWAKILRIVGIVLMSLTAAFTLMGGAGTTCVALNPTGFGGKFAGIASFQWLWILFVLIGIAAGIMGVRSVVMLIKGKKHAYRAAITALVVGAVLNAVHMVASQALRGASMPVDGVLYTNVLTLIIFLSFRIPAIWQGVDYEKPTNNPQVNKNTTSFALIAVGLLSITIQFLMAPTHTIAGINYADVWHATLSILGGGLIFSGMLAMFMPQISILNFKMPWMEKSTRQ